MAGGVVLITAGVDVQDDRLEVELVGWGRDEESWSVDYRTLYGDPSSPGVWGELDAYLGETWKALARNRDARQGGLCGLWRASYAGGLYFL